MAVTIFGGDLKTGLIRVRNIPASAGNVSEILGGAGTIGCTVPLPMKSPRSPAVVPIRDLLLPGKSFLGWEENGRILNAGPIWNDSYDFDRNRLTLNAAGIRSYWQFRFVLPALVEAGVNLPPGNDSIYTAMHLRTIAKRLVQQAQAWTNGSVPIVFEADFPGTAQRTYLGHELHVVDEKLKQLSEVINGPDIMFPARYTSDARTHIEWVMRTGDPELTSLVPHKWDMTGIPRPAIKGASITRDATVLSNVNYQTGATDDLDPEGYPLMAKAMDAELTGLDFPILESATDRTSVTSLNVLQSHADQAVITGRKYSEAWKFSTRKNIVPKIGEFEPGDKAIISTLDDAAVGTDDHELRIMEISSRLGDAFASVTCAPKRGA